MKNLNQINMKDDYLNEIRSEFFKRNFNLIFIVDITKVDYFYKIRRFFKNEYLDFSSLPDEYLLKELNNILPRNMVVRLLPMGVSLENAPAKPKTKLSKRSKKSKIIKKYLNQYYDNSAADIKRLLEKNENMKVSYATIKKYKGIVEGERKNA